MQHSYCVRHASWALVLGRTRSMLSRRCCVVRGDWYGELVPLYSEYRLLGNPREYPSGDELKKINILWDWEKVHHLIQFT